MTAAGARAEQPRLDTPRADEIGRAPAQIPETTLSARAAATAIPPGSWGGAYTASTGETVMVYASRLYPQDAAIGQRWADFVANLAHGTELASVFVYLAPSSEVQRLCGQYALACYGVTESLLIAPGDDPASDISAEAVVTHEYGHHLAAHRLNPPWRAVDFGTKRWASYEQVCANARAGRMFPGAEADDRYQLNPGEGFAESYRVLSQRRAGVAEMPWQVVSRVFYPDDASLNALLADVTAPWTRSTTLSLASSVSSTKRTRTWTVATPLDGKLSVAVRTAGGARVSLDVLGPSSRLAHTPARAAVSASTTICGQRSVRLRVTRMTGAGSVRLTLARP